MYGKIMAASVALLSATAATANPFETRLDNGLKVVVKEDRRAPTAAHMVWYRAGSMDEVDGESGVAHLLEHLMFKGTPTVAAGEFSKRVAAAGGRDNAFTSRDYTAYFQQVPREQLATVMELEADRMRHLTLSADEFEPERKVVMEERRLRTDDEPQSQLFEQLMATAFIANPYRRPVIGWMNDLENMVVADARRWYDTWYAPNNATLVVVGDVEHEDVFALAKKFYGPMSAKALPLRKPREEPEQKGIRRVVVKAPADLPTVVLAFKAPVLRNPDTDRDPYALEMLAAVLDGHSAARIPTQLIRATAVAVSAGVGYDSTARGPGLFYLSASPSRGQTVETLEAALRAEIQRIAAEGVRDDELARAKAQLVASQIYKRDSMFAQAMEIGMLETIGFSHEDDETMIKQLKTVTSDEIKRVAGQYFSDATLTVAVLDPQPLPAGKAAQPAPGRH
jgi:zinc protease